MWTLRTRLRRCWLGQIRKDRLHIRMQASQDVEIVRVLIDGYQPGIALSLQFDDQVLPHQPCSAGQDQPP